MLLLLFAALAAAQQCRITAITPAQPELKVEEGERATESQTFRTTAFALSPTNVPHYFDTANRIRRITPEGRLITIAGNGQRADIVNPGPALEIPLPTIGQILFSPDGTPHFTATGRVFRIANGRIEAVAGSGRPGFNGEEALALDLNLGGIVNAVFTPAGRLLIIDGFNRVRRLDPDGMIRTIAGSTRVAAANGITGDEGPATEAALSNPRQLVPLADGSFWIKDLGGRHLRLVRPDGIIDTVNTNFDASINILLLANGVPAAGTSGRLYPIRPDGNIETGARPFAPFTGTPLAVGSDNSLFFLGNARPEQNNPLVRLTGQTQTVIAGAPVARLVDGQAAPFGVWNPRTGSLFYASTQEGKAGVLEARPGQQPRFVLGGGADIADADGKNATDLNIFGIVAFTIDGAGRIVVADVYRRRILIVETGGRVSILKSQGADVVYAPLGSFSSLQRIAADNDGNIYWYQQGATPPGGVFTADIAVWNRATSNISRFTVAGFAALTRLDDGSVAVLAGNGANFRTAYRVEAARQAEALPAYGMLPLQSVTRWQDQPYFTAATRLFRGAPGQIQMLNEPLLAPGSSALPDFVVASPTAPLVHLTNGGFYRIDNPDACAWLQQPVVESLVNAASLDFPDTVSPRQLITVFAKGFGPPEGQGMILDGFRRATGQPAPYPALLLGNFSGAIPNATLTGTSLPVVSSNDSQVTMQAPITAPASGEYRLYFSWQGLQLIYPNIVRSAPATPGLFPLDATAAAPGSVIHLLGTGFGAVNRTVVLGEFFSNDPPATTNPVIVTIGGLDAEVEFAGGAPGRLSGIYQLTVRIPENIDPGDHSVVARTGGQQSTPLTIRVSN